jgi:hypothetical protein
LNVKYSRGGPHCKVLFKIREAQQLIEYQQRKNKIKNCIRAEGKKGGPRWTRDDNPTTRKGREPTTLGKDC